MAKTGFELRGDADVVVDCETLCALLKLEARTVRDFAQKHPSVKQLRGRYYLAAFVREYVKSWQARAEGRSGPDVTAMLDEARAKKAVTEARMAERELAEVEGRTIPLEVHTQRFAARCEQLAGSVKGMGRYALDVVAATNEEAADELLDRMEDELLAQLRAAADDIEDEPPAEDHPDAHGDRDRAA